MNSGPIAKFLQNISAIITAVSVAAVAIPASRAAEPDLVSALRDKGAPSSDPAQAWFARDDGPAGRHARDRIARNNTLFDTWGERSVPLIAYRTARGGAAGGGIAHRVGDIADLGAWLRELGDE